MSIPDFMSKPDTAALFSPLNPQYPRQDLMEHLAEIFLRRLGAHLPFTTSATLMPLVRSRELQPVLANGIAALASRLVVRCDVNVEVVLIYLRVQLDSQIGRNLLLTINVTLSEMRIYKWPRYDTHNPAK
jgi:hypothetical protein